MEAHDVIFKESPAEIGHVDGRLDGVDVATEHTPGEAGTKIDAQARVGMMGWFTVL